MKPLLGTLCTIALIACSSAEVATRTQEKAGALDGTRWAFEASSLIDIWVEPIGNDPLILEFDNGRATGYSGCNSFFGEYTLDESLISFDPLGSTRMICEEDIQAQEDTLLEAFERVRAFEINEVYLYLDTGDGTALVYRRLPAE